MMTETQKRVARAQAMLDSGMDAKEVARECGYKNVNGMMGAIALQGRSTSKVAQASAVPAAQTNKPESAEQKPEIWAPRRERMVPRPIAVPETREEIERATACAPITPNDVTSRAPEGTAVRNQYSIVVETCGIALKYNEETRSVMLNMTGNPRFLWLDGRRVPGGAAKLMRGLRDAAAAMAVLLEEKEDRR